MGTERPHEYDYPPVECSYENSTMKSCDRYEYIWQDGINKMGADTHKQEDKDEKRKKRNKRKRCLIILFIILGFDIVLTVTCVVLATKGKWLNVNDAQAYTGTKENIFVGRLHANLQTNLSNSLMQQKMERISAKIDYWRKIRLVGGSTLKEGRVEILHNGEWGTICDDNWGLQEASVVCGTLGFGAAVEAPTNARFGPGIGRIWLDQVACTGVEATVGECIHDQWGENNCGHDEDASVICE